MQPRSIALTALAIICAGATAWLVWPSPPTQSLRPAPRQRSTGDPKIIEAVNAAIARRNAAGSTPIDEKHLESSVEFVQAEISPHIIEPSSSPLTQHQRNRLARAVARLVVARSIADGHRYYQFVSSHPGRWLTPSDAIPDAAALPRPGEPSWLVTTLRNAGIDESRATNPPEALIPEIINGLNSGRFRNRLASLALGEDACAVSVSDALTTYRPSDYLDKVWHENSGVRRAGLMAPATGQGALLRRSTTTPDAVLAAEGSVRLAWAIFVGDIDRGRRVGASVYMYWSGAADDWLVHNVFSQGEFIYEMVY